MKVLFTKQNVQDLSRLLTKFNDRCEHIKTLLVRLSEDFIYMNTYELDEDEVWCQGDEYRGRKFPASLLTLTDDEINKWIDGELQKREEEKKRMSIAKKALDKFEEERMIRKLSDKYNITPKNE